MLIKNPFDTPFDNLPDTLPVFPMENMLILPGGQVPLHIFEQRYINLVQDALASRDRLMGLAMQKESPLLSKKSTLNSIGCAARITSFEETPDGRFIITLTGYCRFAIKKEISSMRGYQRFSVNWGDFRNDISIQPNPDIDRQKLISLLQEYSRALHIDMDWSSLSETPNFNLVTFFAMTLPFKHSDKYPLLEALTVEERADVLISTIQSEIKTIQEHEKGANDD
jgi:hypothetical protein